MDENNAAERLDLPREEYEPVVSRPVDLEFMGMEVILSVFDIKGDHEIRTCYGDICKTVNALRDYSKLLTMVCDTWDLHGFHRIKYEFYAEKLREIADKLQAGIGYDYDAAMEQCEKRKGKSIVRKIRAARPWPWAFSKPSRLRRPRPGRPLRRKLEESPPRLKMPQRMDLGWKMFDALRNY